MFRSGGSTQGSSSHSMDGMYSALWEPSQGLVQFSGVTYVDGQLATYYDSQTRRAQPRISWMKNVEKYYPQFWDINTWRFQSSEQRFRRDLVNLQKHYNQTRDPPTVKVTLMAGHDGLETLICQAYGFYPKEIDTTWRKDREVLEQQTFRRDVAPNSDRTYYAWLSIQIDPEDKDHYWCHVEHDGLLEPLDVAFREPGERLGGREGWLASWESGMHVAVLQGEFSSREERETPGRDPAAAAAASVTVRTPRRKLFVF
ncbi:HLA class I histocompatibility antigen, B alpha chain-like [Rhineura floridana]|uniref:HLA class I histocompatibility antigen, B alpha chain-like n=1 Tax=Rhineura floridana TaxID=261503 RepID=UPI002AC86887|nr:HLA class I histocompatibility antigen, B alpha chain-like [Rhineura floridana]